MLKTRSISSASEYRKSIYRPVHHARAEHEQSWQCISISYPLVKIVRGFAVWDFIRGIIDTCIIVGVLLFTLEFEYQDVALIRSKPMDDDDSKYATTYVSHTKKEYEKNFIHIKRAFCIILGLTICIVISEVPLAIFLFKAIQKRVKSHLTMWIQISVVLIVFNFFAFICIISYLSKIGLMVEDDTWVATDGSNLIYLVYIILLRTATFDLTKGVEVIFVSAFSKEVFIRQQVLTSVDNDNESQIT